MHFRKQKSKSAHIKSVNKIIHKRSIYRGRTMFIDFEFIVLPRQNVVTGIVFAS